MELRRGAASITILAEKRIFFFSMEHARPGKRVAVIVLPKRAQQQLQCGTAVGLPPPRFAPFGWVEPCGSNRQRGGTRRGEQQTGEQRTGY